MKTGWIVSFCRTLHRSAHDNQVESGTRPGRGSRKNCRLIRHLAITTAALLWVAGADAFSVRAQSDSAPPTTSMTVGTPTTDANGVKYYPVTSVYQGSQQQIIRVLQPTNPVLGKPRRILYVLPVEQGVTTQSSEFGDGLEELRLLNVPNRFNMTLIAPSFNYEPWYGDNPNDPTLRMESFITADLVAFGDTFGQVGTTPKRFLLGFSKSGNGALFNSQASGDVRCNRRLGFSGAAE